MKKLLTLLFSLSFGLCFAQTNVPFLNSRWSADNIETIKNEVGSLIGSAYKFTDKQVLDKPGVAYIKYENAAEARNVTVTLQKGIAGGDVEMGVKPTEVVRAVVIDGLFVDMFAAYKKLFNAPVSLDEVKQKGYASMPAIKEGGKTYTVSFARADSNKPGNWQMVVKTM